MLHACFKKCLWMEFLKKWIFETRKFFAYLSLILQHVADPLKQMRLQG